jgi:hypothetical protein
LPIGACCLADGTCVDATEGDCTAQGGTYQGDGTDCFANAVMDPSFEAGAFGGVWTESSTNFGTPLCDAGCGFGGGTGPNSGSWWAWFGGVPAFEDGSVSQAVLIPANATTLDFWLEVPVSSGNGVDFLEVLIDGNQEFLVLENAGPFVGYALQQIPLGAYADGGVHTIEFHSTITGTFAAGAAFTNFFVDDVAINVQETVCMLPCHTLTLDDGGFSHGDSAENIVGPGLLLDVDGVSYNHDTCAPQGTAFTALVFDSTNGPFNQDPDLHVNSGNVLILQTNSGAAVNPNDDDDGGVMTFLFTSGVEPTSIDLIDIDAAAAEVTTVTLVDGLVRSRVYTVPANWTGDVTLAQPGIGTLALNTLAPQLGPNGGMATAVEDAGFDATDVSIVIVNRGGCGANVNGGSGAVDNLSWCE